MIGKIAVGIIIFILIWLWIMWPYYKAYNKEEIPAGLIVSAWIFIPAYIAATGVYLLIKAGWL